MEKPTKTLESQAKSPHSHRLRVRAMRFAGGDQLLIIDGLAGAPESRQPPEKEPL